MLNWIVIIGVITAIINLASANTLRNGFDEFFLGGFGCPIDGKNVLFLDESLVLGCLSSGSLHNTADKSCQIYYMNCWDQIVSFAAIT